MAFRVRIRRINRAGTPIGWVRVYDAGSEADALTVAAYEIDARRWGEAHVAMVTDAAGRLLFTYTGRAATDAG